MIDTHGHMVAAYVVATVIYVLYAASLYLRARKYRGEGGSSTRSARSE